MELYIEEMKHPSAECGTVNKGEKRHWLKANCSGLKANLFTNWQLYSSKNSYFVFFNTKAVSVAALYSNGKNKRSIKIFFKGHMESFK